MDSFLFNSIFYNIYNKIKKYLARFIAIFFPKSTRDKVRNCVLYPERFLHKYKPSDDLGKHFKYYLSFVAICKNEGRNLPEWIEFHRLVGVEHFYIYDNNSTDNTRNVLDSYIKDGIVTYIKYDGKAKQVPAYNDAIKRFKYDTHWMGFIDIDEFVTPIQNEKISDCLNSFESEYGVSIDWVMYGDNYQIKRKKGLVIERFTKHQTIIDGQISMGKVIVNPRCVSLMFVHLAYFKDNETSVNTNHQHLPFQYGPIGGDLHCGLTDKIRINHYHFKSEEEYLQKAKKGRADAFDYKARKKDLLDKWRQNLHMHNDVEDNIMEKYVPLIKSKLRKRGLF